MTKKLSIGFIGTRGIPNRYGGYEAAVEQLAPRLVSAGHNVTVYCSKRMKYGYTTWKGVKLVHKFDPEDSMGPAGQFLYDLLCNISSYRRKHDVIIHMGYTSDSVWHFMWDRNSKHIINVDGLEWKRSKYSSLVQRFLKIAEKWAVLRSDLIIADSPGIKKHISKTYNASSEYIAYGVEIPNDFDDSELEAYNILPYKYDLIIARMVPENNIEMAIESKTWSTDAFPLVIIGNENQYFHNLRNRYQANGKIMFFGPNYNRKILDSIRYYSRYYIHGHSVGGTNPSLLEAMAAQCRILAHDNIFNRSVLLGGGEYFSSSRQLSEILSDNESIIISDQQINKNIDVLKEKFTWDKICSLYEKAFYKV